jgi:hypothetical protein
MSLLGDRVQCVADYDRVELVEFLRGKCDGVLVDALLDGGNYTKDGRLNRSALSRALGWSACKVNTELGLLRDLVVGLL